MNKIYKVVFSKRTGTFVVASELAKSVGKAVSTVIPPKRAASKSRINTSPAFSAGRVSLLKPSYAFALE